MNYIGVEFDQQAAALLSPSDYQNPTPKDRYHLVVIGAGPAGLISAIGAAGLGANVALIERHRMGGDCLNVGCVPSKALLEYTGHARADFDEAFHHLRKIRADIAPHDSVERYSELGVDVFLGDASFNAQGKVQVGDVLFNTRRVAICTGARASLPPIPGLDQCDALTNETLFDLVNCPASIGILGAGAIGCEMATVFARLGVEVHLFELADRVLPLEAPAASQTVAEALQKLGVTLHLGAGVAAIEPGTPHVIKAEQSVQVEKILVALGRAPNTESLQLANAGIETNPRGQILTDAKLRTSNKQVYAAGDCTTNPQFTHSADAQARVLVQNTLIAPTASVAGFVTPRCTYTSPEVASIGHSEATANEQGIAYETLEFDLGELDRGRTRVQAPGYVQVLLKPGTDKMIGASIVDSDAGELISPLCLMMSNGIGLGAAVKTQLPYPTRSEFLKRLGDAYNRTRVTPMVSKIFATWLKVFK
ncbi:MAG: FAD-dependent oxidoreductase [Pseudomonadota bacterium]